MNPVEIIISVCKVYLKKKFPTEMKTATIMSKSFNFWNRF